jgi:agmatine deiminase
MPSEWEPQAAVWLQWPQGWEGRGLEDALVDIVANLVDFEDVHLIVRDAALQSSAERSLGSVGLERGPLRVWQTDSSSWLRDDGPRVVEVDGELVLQSLEFDGWGAADGSGGFGAVPCDLDHPIPDDIGAELALSIEHVSLIHEGGDLEVNGQDTALVNWSVVRGQ